MILEVPDSPGSQYPSIAHLVLFNPSTPKSKFGYSVSTWEYGTNNVATITINTSRSVPNICATLIVGIGGGSPT